MQLEAGVGLQPSSDLRCLMRAVAVEDEVSLRVVGHSSSMRPRSCYELRRPVTALQRADHRAGGHVQGGEEDGGGVRTSSWLRRSGLAGIIAQGRLRSAER